MNKHEAQKRFAEKSNIKNSEYNRQNTNATRNASPTAKGNNLLPNEPAIKKVLSSDLAIQIISVLIGILFFKFATPLGRIFVSYETYSSLGYLFFSLVITVLLVLALIRLMKKIYRTYF